MSGIAQERNHIICDKRRKARASEERILFALTMPEDC